jgi:hypothetical protein
MLEYVLTVSILWEGCCNIYAGSFDSCARAQEYYDTVLARDYGGMSCLHKDHIVLPKDFEHQAPILLPEIVVRPK